MASDTKNVKLGVCKVFFDGNDLGYTQGGVEVTVSTETHRVEIDQFGKTAINELIMGRSVMVKCPLAETTLENMVRIMPGATLVTAGGVKATGTYTVATPTATQTAIFNGVTFTFRTGTAPLSTDILIGGTAILTADNMRTKLNASFDPKIAVAEYTGATAVVTVTYGVEGTGGNDYTLAVGTATGSAVSGATLTGGAESTAKRVDVTDGVGTDLLATAKKLVLHPKSKVDTDKTEDFVLPLAATPGGLTFAYKLDAERIYNVEFTGYPDTTNSNKLFWIGDLDVVES